jgi:hypothetical protein
LGVYWKSLHQPHDFSLFYLEIMVIGGFSAMCMVPGILVIMIKTLFSALSKK